MPTSLKKELPVLVRLAVLEGMEAHEKRCYDKNLCPMQTKIDKVNAKIAWAGGGLAATIFLVKLFWK